MGKHQKTIRTMEELEGWLENNPSDETKLVEGKRGNHVVVSNYHDIIRVPQELWQRAPIRPGHRFDRRMWRWGTEPPSVLYVHPDVITSTRVFPIQAHTMASKLKGQDGCTVPLMVVPT